MALCDPSLSALKAWTVDKDPRVANVAILMAAFSAHLQAGDALMLALKEQNVPLPICAAQWAKLYRNHRIWGDFIEGMASELLALMATYSQIEELNKIPEQEATKAQHEKMQALILEFAFAYLRCDFEPLIEGKSEEECLPLVFFIKVVAECKLHYRTFPTFLLRRARHGDVEAMDQLLRIDQLVTSEPTFQTALNRIPKGFQMQQQLMNATPAYADPEQVKFRAAAEIWQMGDNMEGVKGLSYRDVAQLFHALAQDTTGAPFDADIQHMTQQSWAQRLRRINKAGGGGILLG